MKRGTSKQRPPSQKRRISRENGEGSVLFMGGMVEGSSGTRKPGKSHRKSSKKSSKKNKTKKKKSSRRQEDGTSKKQMDSPALVEGGRSTHKEKVQRSSSPSTSGESKPVLQRKRSGLSFLFHTC